MSGPLPSVNPRNNAFGGGSITRAGPPTGASGSFSSIGASGFPNPGIPTIATARNNRGTNVSIPYARVVPLHSKDALPVQDDKITMSGQKVAHEYDGLESGELAWVLGKQFSFNNDTYAPHLQYAGMATMPLAPPTNPANATAYNLLQQENVMMERMGGAVGFGVDRLQRLAYTNWVDAHFRLRVGRQVINLKQFDMHSETFLNMSSALQKWHKLNILSRDMFAVPDIAYALQSSIEGSASMQVEDPMVQGLFVMERGPFLRSIGTDHRQVQIEAKYDDSLGGGTTTVDKIKPCKVNRHIGSDLAQTALEVCLKNHGVFNWTPDGVCMSKYETGPDGIADAQFDAKMSQLFNVAVQGSAITKTWTGDSRMQCLPTDKVFILVVGDLSYSTVDGPGTATKEAAEKTVALKKAYGVQGRNPNTKEYESTQKAYTKDINLNPKNSVGDAEKFTEWVGKTGRKWTAEEIAEPDFKPPADARDGIAGYEQSLKDPSIDRATVEKYRTRALSLWNEYKQTTGGTDDPLKKEMLGDFDKHAAELRNGTRSVETATLTNLRLMKATSSFLITNSHYRDQDTNPNARLGLPITYDKVKENGSASYVLGGWCIGTVLDSAASRTMSGSVVRVSASSMAMNINVNVEWWNPDKLYQKFQDKERYTKTTSDMYPKALAAGAKNSSSFEVDKNTPLADAKLTAPAGTMRQRDIYREPPSRPFSLDLDSEAWKPPLVGPDTDSFLRVWKDAKP